MTNLNDPRYTFYKEQLQESTDPYATAAKLIVNIGKNKKRTKAEKCREFEMLVQAYKDLSKT